MPQHWILGLAFLFSITLLYLRPRKPYPPGPRGLPFLGVSLIHPKKEFWKTYAEWDKQYGGHGIISFHVSGRRLVVVNSVKVAEDLLNKRSINYSDRPFPMMAGHLMDRAKSIFYISNNGRFKAYRRLLHKAFNPVASFDYCDVQEHEAHLLVENILNKPERMVDHLRKDAASLILKVAFGYDVTGENDRFIALAEEALTLGSLAAAPGRWLVDSWPILRFVPDWFPGAGFKRKAKEWGQRLYAQSLVPHEYVKQQMAAGTAYPSFTATLLRGEDEKPVGEDTEDIVLWTAGSLYAAGSDTSVVAMENIILLMLLHPDVQEKAQEEIDAFIARENRLPNCRDRTSMPYVVAMIKECLRLLPPSPMGIAHCCANDDVYNGYYIPAKTPVLGNIWAIMHDETAYPDPFVFDPERFLGKNGRVVEPEPLAAFGFGRRLCPGKTVGENSVFIQTVLLLATMKFSKGVDSAGNVIEPELEFSTGIVSHVKPYRYHVKERAPQVVAMIRQALAAHSHS